MNNNDLNYFRINHKNSLEMMSYIEDDSLLHSMFATIVSMQEDSIGNVINKYFNLLIEKNDSDLFDVNISQTRKYQSMFNDSQEDIELAFSVNDVLYTDYGTTFDFTEDTTESIMRMLCYSFNSLKNEKKKYNITNHKEMLSCIDKVIVSKVDAMKMFVPNQRYDNNFNSFISNSNSDSIEKVKMKNIYTYPFINSNNDDNNNVEVNYDIPLEMIILINKFQCVKKVVFSMENINKKRKLEIILILLNSQWLFPHVLEVEFNITDEHMQRDLNEIINNKMSRKCKQIPKKTTMYDFNYNKSFKWTPKEKEDYHKVSGVNSMNNNRIDDNNNRLTTTLDNDRSYPLLSSYTSLNDYVTKIKRDFFDMIIIYSYFISQIKYLKTLLIKYQDCYSCEIKKILQSVNVDIVDFHFFKFFNQMSTLTEIALIFNSLDTQSFEEAISLIHNNRNLISLKLNLFNTDNNYTPASLYKLCNSLKMNINEIYSDTLFSFGDKCFENDEIDHLLINKLLQCFEENLEKLLLVLLDNLKIRELIFYFDLPKILSINESYLMVLIKFVFNLLFLLTKEKHKYRTVKIISPELWFNSRKNPFIEEYLEEINLERGDEVDLNSLTIQLGFYHVENIGNFLFPKLKNFFIGDLDKETFDYFVIAYNNEEFISSSELNTITVSLNKTITNYAFIHNSFEMFFKNKPRNLKEQNIISYIKLDKLEEAKEIVDIIYTKNKVKVNCIEFNEGGDLLNQVLSNHTNITLTLFHIFSTITKYNNNNKPQTNILIVKSIRNFLFYSKPYVFKCRY